jgi:hypothetical protein
MYASGVILGHDYPQQFMTTFDLDNVEQWGPSLRAHLAPVVDAAAGSKIAGKKLTYFEDAAEILFAEVCSKDVFRKFAQEWFIEQNIAGYHGSRLDEQDVEDIRSTGLRILSASDRKAHLEKKLKTRPDVHGKIDEVLNLLGNGEAAGRREGQVHTTLSRAGLVHHFNVSFRQGCVSQGGMRQGVKGSRCASLHRRV